MSIGVRINYVRKQMKLTQKQFADELGISQTHVSKLEKDVEKPSPTLIRLISVLYNFNEDWLIRGEGSPELGWDISNDDGAINKYKAMRLQFENKVKSRTGQDLYNTIEAFSYFDAILSPRNLAESAITQYLEYIEIIMDDLEKLTYKVSSRSLYPKKTNAEGWLKYHKECETYMLEINEHIRKTVNLYIEEAGDNMKL